MPDTIIEAYVEETLKDGFDMPGMGAMDWPMICTMMPMQATLVMAVIGKAMLHALDYDAAECSPDSRSEEIILELAKWGIEI